MIAESLNVNEDDEEVEHWNVEKRLEEEVWLYESTKLKTVGSLVMF